MKQELVRSLFTYYRGHLYWKERPPEAFTQHCTYVMWNRRYANKPAGNKGKRGYIKIAINKKWYFEHRLVWLYHKGWLPKFLDHKNGVFWDNRMSNLRPATCMENRWNSRRRQPTKSNVKGVYKRKDGAYEAHICSEFKRYYIGRFVSKSAAARAVAAYRNDLHKEFARHG